MGQSASSALVDKNLLLPALLERADEKELSVLADLITDKGKGRLMLNKSLKDLIISFQKKNKLCEISDTLAKEVCAFGSHSAMNVFRSGEGAEYSAILKDVAKILGAESKEATDVYSLERGVLAALILKAVNDKVDAELFKDLKCKDRTSNALIAESIHKTAKGKREHLVETILDVFDAELVRKLVERVLTEKYILMLCSGIGAVTNVGASGAGIMATAKLAGGIAARFNPLVAAVSGAASAFSLSGPAFRIAIPAVMQIALIRYHQTALETQQFCEELESCL
ncbi:hypothetical protein P3626_14515 [Vibrio parahaemolyticus]|uniref:hypothetical protein n=1 Tax=Vibrio parahaemolyticus TaxID=670 RepID=UPI0018697917|nr:hypothetical protein [Vibrio parahaemolyticus]EJE8522554.1 hypothetical protein [Vibrio parahaemolyticus]ELB2176339.1 hypothetical protein [Vibrio parahaemolyticus]MBE4060414.1 hypothetical protein [Vibrio parahaemolyticus]MBE4152196.1 hypothetical protein [Vibrio parahaemolyticus]MBE4428620.1 hypothetical protein [Vibrio parahaemolyticus]